MLIKPKIRNHICTTAHPVGCHQTVQRQIDHCIEHKHLGPYKNVLIIGCSTGYGLSTRIAATVGCNANTLGVMFERPPTDKRGASAGWYNNSSVEALAKQRKLQYATINADAFSNETKQQVAERIKTQFGKIDLLIYSLASPRRKDAESDQVWQSVLKPVGKDFHGTTLDTDQNTLKSVQVEAASDDEINATVKVMGGEDWNNWVRYLQTANVLAPGFQTLAYSYLGGDLTWPIYGDATIGLAKRDLATHAANIDSRLKTIDGSAHVAVLKATVTQSSSAIPVFPLYVSVLYSVMKQQGNHETDIQQIIRLFGSKLAEAKHNDDIYIRLDDFELSTATQALVKERWQTLSDENLAELCDLDGYQTEFLNLFGFGYEGVDYDREIDPLSGRYLEMHSEQSL